MLSKLFFNTGTFWAIVLSVGAADHSKRYLHVWPHFKFICYAVVQRIVNF